ncbi:MAG TPA: M4 family metallopeptidase [Holophaga sp.]|nr:M4 family metallopeptidase [Holophaga sp.]
MRIELFIFLTLALAGAGPSPAARDALSHLQASRASLGLAEGTDFIVEDEVKDDLGMIHVRLQQTWKGLPVWGGQAIVHRGAGGSGAPLTDALVRGADLETTPNLGEPEALAAALDRLGIHKGFSTPPTARLVLWPEMDARPPDGVDGADPRAEPQVVRHHLAWHVHVEAADEAGSPIRQDALVDAHTGAVLRTWSTLFTLSPRDFIRKILLTPPADLRATGDPAEGRGRSQYSGPVRLGVLDAGGTFLLQDPTRGGIATRNLGGGWLGFGSAIASQHPAWGDGLDYDASRGPDSVNGQTAAVDAHFGLQAAWDFCRDVLGRNGIDGKGRAPLNLVHFGRGFPNAFWDGTCYCMHYGDGPGGRPLTSLEVVGHELGHGICASTAGLVYEGESGGLNEANSDILGVLIRAYARAGAQGKTLPDGEIDWTLAGEALGHPVRWMDKPSRDGFSPDAWSPWIRTLNPHRSSGPMNRAFYFLAQGASARRGDDAWSPRIPQGMKGIGNTKALRIWWRTLTTRLTPRSGYREARDGALASARELYGKDSPEFKAVDLAFRGVNVGRHRKGQ